MMMTGLAIGFGILAVLLGLTLRKLIWQIRDLERQIRFLEEKQSNADVVCDIRFGGIGRLTDTLNQVFEQQKSRRQQWIRNEKRIAQTYTNLSHDIRTPLTSLDGYFQLLAQTDDRETQERYLRIIQERIHALRDILEELFMFTRLESRTYEMKLEECDFNAVLKETLFSYYEEWENNGIEPVFDLPEGKMPVLGNEAAIRRILQNIIKNVLDHGGRSVEISLFAVEGKACVIVQNKVEHPEEIDVSRIFERFYKADPARSRTSTGLGMAIARELTEYMNGRISASLEGDIFQLKLQIPMV